MDVIPVHCGLCVDFVDLTACGGAGVFSAEVAAPGVRSDPLLPDQPDHH